MYQLQCYSSVRFCNEPELDIILRSKGSFSITFFELLARTVIFGIATKMVYDYVMRDPLCNICAIRHN